MSGKSTNPSGPGGAWEPLEARELEKLLDGYEIGGRIGAGGMAAVYRGIQTNMGRAVAVKVMPASAGADYAFAARFEREAQTMAQLAHPNIVTVYDFGRAGVDPTDAESGLLYLVMEFVEGSDLHQLGKSGKLDRARVPSYLIAVAEALGYAHGQGVIHRDIKPANIMVRQDGMVKVADFGLAKLQDPEAAQMTVTGYAMGTPDYVAPESLEAGATVDHRADIYSLGVLAYELFTGKVPRGAFELPSKLDPTLDRRIDTVIERAMKRDPGDRFASAEEFSAALKAAMSGPKLITGTTGKVKLATGRVSPTGTASSRAVVASGTGRVVARPKVAASSGIPSGGESGGGTWKVIAGGIAGAAVVVIGAVLAMSGADEKGSGENFEPTGGSGHQAGLGESERDSGADIWTPPSRGESGEADSDSEGGDAKGDTVAVSDPGDGRVEPSATFTHISFPLPLPRRPEIGGQLVHFPFLVEPETKDAHLRVIPELEDVVQVAVPGRDASDESMDYYPGTGLALDASGKVTAWGRFNEAQCATPEDLGDVVQVAAGHDACFALLSDGKLRGWGGNSKGELDVPTEVQGKIVRVAAADSRVVVLLRDGTVRGWGHPVELPDGNGYVDVAAFTGSTLTLSVAGELRVWGASALQLGEIPEPVREVAVTHHGSALTEAGRWYRFGNNLDDFQEVHRSGGPFARIALLNIRNSMIPESHRFAVSEQGELVHGGPPSVHPGFVREASDCIGLVAWRTHAIGIRIPDADVRGDALAEREAIRLHGDSDRIVATAAGELEADGSEDSQLPHPPELDGPAPEIAGGRLAKLFGSYRQAVADRVEVPRADALENLRKLYTGGLGRAEDTAAAGGDLDAVLALQDEAKRIASGEVVPNEDEEGIPEALEAIRETYRAERKRIEAARAAAAAPLRQKFKAALIDLEADLTKSKNIPDALAVRKFREGLGAPPKEPVTVVESENPKTDDSSVLPVEDPDASAPVGDMSKPGRLRSFGHYFVAKDEESGLVPMRVEEFSEIDDFVQVVAMERGWMALRANGSAVGMRKQSGANPPVKLEVSGIARLFAPTNGDPPRAITAEGVFGQITGKGFVPDKWLEGKGKVVGWGNGHHHQIALTADGVAHLSQGGVYNPAHQKPFSSPPPEALKDVALVAGTRYAGATLTKDGRLYHWWQGGVASAEIDLSGRVTHLFSRPGKFLLRTERSELFEVNMAEGEIRLPPNPNFKGVSSLSCNTYSTPLVRSYGRWRANYGNDKQVLSDFYDAVLRELPNEATSVGHWFGDGGRFAVWIEPAK